MCLSWREGNPRVWWSAWSMVKIGCWMLHCYRSQRRYTIPWQAWFSIKQTLEKKMLVGDCCFFHPAVVVHSCISCSSMSGLKARKPLNARDGEVAAFRSRPPRTKLCLRTCLQKPMVYWLVVLVYNCFIIYVYCSILQLKNSQTSQPEFFKNGNQPAMFFLFMFSLFLWPKTSPQVCPKEFGAHGAAMFTAGALLGPALDGVSHGNFGVRPPSGCPLWLPSHVDNPRYDNVSYIYVYFITALWCFMYIHTLSIICSALYIYIQFTLQVYSTISPTKLHKKYQVMLI